MIVFGKTLTQKEIEAETLTELIRILLTDHLIRNQRPNDHLGAYREQQVIAKEISRRCGEDILVDVAVPARIRPDWLLKHGKTQRTGPGSRAERRCVMKITVNTKYIKGEVELKFGEYQNGSPAIQAFSLYGEPEFVATVALDELPADGHVFLKGWSENEGIPQALVNAGIVKLTGRTIPIGYCEAQEAKLLISNNSELRKA